MTTGDIEDLFVTLLVGVAGGSDASWRKAVGPVTALPVVFHPRSNWSIAPQGSARQIEAIEKAEAIIRQEHPYSLSHFCVSPTAAASAACCSKESESIK